QESLLDRTSRRPDRGRGAHLAARSGLACRTESIPPIPSRVSPLPRWSSGKTDVWLARKRAMPRHGRRIRHGARLLAPATIAALLGLAMAVCSASPASAFTFD